MPETVKAKAFLLLQSVKWGPGKVNPIYRKREEI